MNLRVLTLSTMLLLPTFAYPFGFKIKVGPIKVQHNAHKAKVNIDVNKPVEKTVEATVDAGRAALHTVEGVAKAATGDNKGSKEAFKKAEDDVKDAGQNTVDTVKKTGDLAYHTVIKLPIVAGEQIVHDGRDLTIELMTGEDPDEVRAEIHKMLAECQSRTTDLEKLEKYIRTEENFARNGDRFETLMHVLTALAIESGDPYAIGSAAIVQTLYAGMDHKMKELKKEYEATVKVCEESYKNKVDEIESLLNANERKIAINRNKVIARISLLQNEIEEQVSKVSAQFKTAIEEYLSRSVENKELQGLLEEYSYLIQDDIDALDIDLKKKAEEISSLNDILANPDQLLYYEEK